MQKSLVALDTNHLKDYIFKTDVLKEIRGAGSILDRLSRVTMVDIARQSSADLIYAYGGAGLFLIDEDKADVFGKKIQRAFLDTSRGGSSITYAVQHLPTDGSESVEKLMMYDFRRELTLIRYKLREEKDHADRILALPAHPFLRPCDACGLEYAEEREADRGGPCFYCAGCKEKRDEDERVKERIERVIRALREGRSRKTPPPATEAMTARQRFLWDRILFSLEKTEYKHLFDSGQQIPERPDDFTLFRRFSHAKEYLGLIYADANTIGAKIEALTTLSEVKDFAASIDQAIHAATFSAIESELPISIVPGEQTDKAMLFPFEVLLLGGDKVMLVTDASRAMDVALALGQEFRRFTKNKHSLSVGVVLAPGNYPFGLLLDLVESTLKFAKKKSAEVRASLPNEDDTSINFMTVASGSLNSFDAIYNKMYHKIHKDTEFYATLRPYTPDKLKYLLNSIREGNRLNLRRSRLHQLRDAVVKMNLTQSVFDGLAILRNWREAERRLIVGHVYQFGGLYQMSYSNAHDPIKGFPRITFPWFADDTPGKKSEKERAVYRTSLLDFVELYDFVSTKGEGIGGEN